MTNLNRSFEYVYLFKNISEDVFHDNMDTYTEYFVWLHTFVMDMDTDIEFFIRNEMRLINK